MGTGKKEASRRDREGTVRDGNIRVKGENFYRSAKRVKQLNMYKEGRAQRDADGNITKAAIFQSRDVPTAVIEPNRKWFQNSRVISQESLTAFRAAMAEQAKDPHRFLLKSAKLPMSLIRDDTAAAAKQRPALVETFSDVFGAKATRKRVTMKNFSTVDDLADSAKQSIASFRDRRTNLMLNGMLGNVGEGGRPAGSSEGGAAADDDLADMDMAMAPPEVGGGDDLSDGAAAAAGLSGNDGSGSGAATSGLMEPVFHKGQSRRIWNELYRTIDSSDVIIHVLDARDPLGTTCKSVEDYLRKEAPHKHLIYILNKCDLVPSGVAARWVKTLQKTVPTCAFRASITNPFGKGSLISLLRQFSSLHADRKQISVGLVGYPNVGKSSVLNALLGRKTCTVAPIPGETKVWQFVRLMKRIYLIDCPGIVPPDSNASAEDILLRGAVRTEKIYNPAQYIAGVLKRTKKHHLARTYDLKDWNNADEFLELLARKRGRLLPGGECDMNGTAIIVLNDFLRGKIPWFTAPPERAAEDKDEGIEGRAGRLGEMPKKRKRDDKESEPATAMGAPLAPAAGEQEEEKEKETEDGTEKAADEDDDFEGFGSDSAPSVYSDSDDEEGPDDMISLGSSSGDEDDEDGEGEGQDEDKSEEDEEDEVEVKKTKAVAAKGKGKGSVIRGGDMPQPAKRARRQR